MTEKQFKEISELLSGILKCKTQAHRSLSVNMIIGILKEMVKTP